MQNSFEITSDFSAYKDIFLEENSKHNLISKNDEKFLYEKHIYDSLALKLFLNKYNINGGTILDIGCGGGFPSVPLAVELKSFKITGIDSINKKINSVNCIKEKLGLKNLELICDRAENLNKKYDIVVSRAVANLEKLSKIALPLLNKNGYFIAYKSKKALLEIDSAKNVLKNCDVIDIIEYQLPLEEIYERNLVVIKCRQK